MAIQSTDAFLVARNGTNYQTPASNIMAIEDTDLLVVNRGGVKYKVTGAEVKEYAGPNILPDASVLPGTFASNFNYDQRSKLWYAAYRVGGGTAGGITITPSLIAATSLDGVTWTDFGGLGGAALNSLYGFGPANLYDNLFVGTGGQANYVPGGFGTQSGPAAYVFNSNGGTTSYTCVDFNETTVNFCSKSGAGGICVYSSGNTTGWSINDLATVGGTGTGIPDGAPRTTNFYLPNADRFFQNVTGPAIFVSSDGKVWNQAASAPAGLGGSTTAYCENLTGSVILAYAGSTIGRSTDGGNNFSAVTLPTPPTGTTFLNQYWFYKTAFFTLAQSSDGTQSYVFKSTDGATFSQSGGNVASVLGVTVSGKVVTDQKVILAAAGGVMRLNPQPFS